PPLDGQTDFSLSTTIKVDSKPPDLPTAYRAFGGDESILISWTPPDSTTDVDAYQVLCARADTGEPGVSDPPDPRYQTAQSLCGMGPGLALGDGQPVANGGDPVALKDLPDELQALNPMFLCGDVQSSTATSIRVQGLENGVAYKVVFLTVDKFWNVRGTFFTSTVTPVPSTDFWEDIHNQGGKADGGLCLLAETYGDDSSLTGALRGFRDETLAQTALGRWLTGVYYDSLGRLGGVVRGSWALRVVAATVLAPLVGVALLWHWLTLPGLLAAAVLLRLWKRYRRRAGRCLPRLAAAVGVAIVALAPARAHAGNSYQPYWENTAIKPEDDQAALDDPSLVHWHAGIRIGPYLPSIDSKLGLTPGPFKQMFGGARPMPMLDVDRFLWNGFGQVGIGFSIGYMQWFAHAFVDGSTPQDNPRMRSPADTNTFRLIPIALTATYRYTKLDDDYGIPVVPYVRAGLSYYLWWVSSNGSVAQICADPASTGCGNKALGASAGLQGSIGIAIRAERIDASTAMSMQQSGIQHAGIYAELSLAKVDGFGSDSKLSVGDATWFAGVDFEF
ncbi:MAG TPA: MXAN_2562 family outer membrane beta-barrel protein, partial [Kofleriaceae bacterium]|nr:MXAN_2562 family outer membrane beta-barrel protein [Kofleriaceae bacterium]